MSLDPTPHEMRRAPREEVEYPSRLTGAAFTALDTLILNISPHGCLAHCAEDVAIGERVTLELPVVGATRGIVIWSLGARIGIEFDMILPLETYFELVVAMARRESP